MQGKRLLLRGNCSIVNSHGEQVHVNESFVMWFNSITLKQLLDQIYSNQFEAIQIRYNSDLIDQLKSISLKGCNQNRI